MTNSRQLLGIAQATAQQQENLLKNAISRNGLEDPLLDAAQVMTLDHIEVPDQDNLPSLRDLVAKALANRPDVALAKINDEVSEISAKGTANGVLPSLQAFAAVSATGLSGTSAPFQGVAPDPYYVGGLGNALGQVFRDNFPSRRAGFLFAGHYTQPRGARRLRHRAIAIAPGRSCRAPQSESIGGGHFQLHGRAAAGPCPLFAGRGFAQAAGRAARKIATIVFFWRGDNQRRGSGANRVGGRAGNGGRDTIGLSATRAFHSIRCWGKRWMSIMFPWSRP